MSINTRSTRHPQLCCPYSPAWGSSHQRSLYSCTDECLRWFDRYWMPSTCCQTWLIETMYDKIMTSTFWWELHNAIALFSTQGDLQMRNEYTMQSTFQHYLFCMVLIVYDKIGSIVQSCLYWDGFKSYALCSYLNKPIHFSMLQLQACRSRLFIMEEKDPSTDPTPVPTAVWKKSCVECILPPVSCLHLLTYCIINCVH